jgi:hypothetical protein
MKTLKKTIHTNVVQHDAPYIIEFLAKNMHPIHRNEGSRFGLNLTRNTKHQMNGGPCKCNKCEGNI